MVVKGEVTYPIQDWSGLNTYQSDGVIKDGELTQCVNFDITDYRTLKKRKGWKKLYAHPNGDTNNFRMIGFNPNTESIVGYSDEGLFWDISGNPNSIAGPLAMPSASYAPKTIITYNGVAYLVGGGPKFLSWDGNDTLTEIDTGADGTHVFDMAVVFKDRLFLGTSGLAEIWYSAVGDPTSWDTSNFIKVDPGDFHGGLTAMIVYQDKLLIFNKNSIWSLTVNGDPENWDLRIVSTSTGSLGSVAIADDVIYFMAKDGVFVTDTITFKEISRPISNRLKNKYDENVFVSKVEDKIYVTFRNSSASSPAYTLFVFNRTVGAWTEYTFPFTRTVTNYFTPGDIFERSFDVSNDIYYSNFMWQGEIWYLTDDYVDFDSIESEITAYFTTKFFELDHGEIMKRGKYAVMDVITEDPGAKFTYNYNFRNRDGDLMQLERILGPRSYKLPGPGYFKSFQFSLIEQSSVPTEIIRISFILQSKRSVIHKQTA